MPADPAHDPLRGRCVDINGGSKGECPAGIAEVPFLTMPRACDGPLATTYDAVSWPSWDAEAQAFLPPFTAGGEALTHDEAGNPQGMTGCGALDFVAELSAQPTARAAASPSGMEIGVKIDDEELMNPTGTAGSDIRKSVLVLPEGVRLNPSQAEGLATCSPAQLAREKASSDFGAGCPAESKVGSVEVETPLLERKGLQGLALRRHPV